MILGYSINEYTNARKSSIKRARTKRINEANQENNTDQGKYRESLNNNYSFWEYLKPYLLEEYSSNNNVSNHIFSGEENLAYTDPTGENDYIVDIPEVTITAQRPRLTSRDDYKRLGEYTRSLRRGEIARENIPFKFRVHLPKSREQAQEVAYSNHRGQEQFNQIMKDRGWDKLEKAYGLGMSSAIALPTISSMASSLPGAVSTITKPTFESSLSAFEPANMSTGQLFMNRFVQPFFWSTVGGGLVDQASRLVTGKSYGKALYDAIVPNSWKNNPYMQQYGPIVGDFFNPGYGQGALIKKGAYGVFNSLDKGFRYLNGVRKRTAESIMRIGDTAVNFDAVKQQLFNQKTKKYIFDPNYSNYAYELPNKYSGQVAGIDGAHPNDIIDVFLGKSNVLEEGSLVDFVPKSLRKNPSKYPVLRVKYNDPRVPEGAQKWLKKNKKDMALLIDFDDITKGSAVTPFDVKQYLGSQEKVFKTSGENAGLLSPESHFLVDPGGYNRTMFINSENNFQIDNFDIWKFTPKEYTKKYFGKLPGMGSLIMDWARNRGLKFLDNAGTPVITKWKQVLPAEEFEIFKNNFKYNILDDIQF